MIRKFVTNLVTHGIVIAALILCASCDILRDSPFEVSEWSPGDGYHADPDALRVSLSFSHDPDRSSVEKHFSLAGDGETVRGAFQWEGRRMDYLPFAPLEKNKEYSVKVASSAHDLKGLSLDREFEGRFSTRPDSSRLRVVSVRPAMEGVMEEGRGNCVIGFSFPVSLNSLRNNASLSPTMPGAWHIEEGGTLAVFTPSEPWPQGKRYELRLAASLLGENQMNMGAEFFSIFTIGANRDPPSLLGAWRIGETGEQEELVKRTLGEYFENAGWEKNDRLKLIFSAAVDLLSVGTALAVEGGASSLVLEMPELANGYCNEAIFRFDKAPAFDSRFSLQLRRGVKDVHGNESEEDYTFRIFANGEHSRPPTLVGIRIPMSPGGTLGFPADLDLRAYGHDQLFADLPIESGHYPYNTKTATWIECYFDCAPGAAIDPFSLMETFRVETSNNVLLFSPLAVRNEGFKAADPHAAWEQYQRLEVAGTLSNTTNAGIVHFVVNSGLKDSAGNSSEKQFRISLNK